MTGKERAAWRAKANSLEPEFQIGKGGMTDGVIRQTLDAFNTKELIKIKVLLESAPETPREFADKLASVDLKLVSNLPAQVKDVVKGEDVYSYTLYAYVPTAYDEIDDDQDDGDKNQDDIDDNGQRRHVTSSLNLKQHACLL